MTLAPPLLAGVPVTQELKRTLLGVVLSMAAFACSSEAAPKPARAPSAAAAPEEAKDLVVELGSTEAVIGGERIKTDDDELRAAVNRHRGGAGAVVIRARPDAPFSALMHVLEATGSSEVALLVGSERRTLPGKSGKKEATGLTLELASERAVLRYASADSRTAQQFEWKFQTPESNSAASEWLRGVCSADECDGIQVAGDPEVTVERLSSALSALDEVRGGKPTRVLALGPYEHHATTDKLPTTKITGRLPAAHVRQVVRDHFDDVRQCYANGVAKNANLRGKVILRFVIGRKGKVENVSDAGSDMPDPKVTNCVIDTFHKLQFDAPDSGIVIVVYPILLSAD